MKRKTNAERRAERKQTREEHLKQNKEAREKRKLVKLVQTMDDTARTLRFGVWQAVTRLTLGEKATEALVPIAVRKLRGEPMLFEPSIKGLLQFFEPTDLFDLGELIVMALNCAQAGRRLSREDRAAHLKAMTSVVRKSEVRLRLEAAKLDTGPVDVAAAKAMVLAAFATASEELKSAQADISARSGQSTGT